MDVATHTLRRTLRDAAAGAWRSSRLFAMVLLAAAVMLGAHYRFPRLDRPGLSSDEGAAWAGASASSAGAVIAAEGKAENGGKLPLFDLVLHEWMRLFGDAPAAMRRLCALNGTIVIGLLFVAVREICRSLGDDSSAATGELAGALAALIYATNFVMVMSDRTAREFALLLTAELLQIFFLVRAQRSGLWTNYAGAAFFTAAMIADNFSSSFLLFAEALWLGCLLLARWTGARAGGLGILRPGLALVAGVALLAPLLPGVLADSARAVRSGAVDWIRPQSVGWALETLHDSANSPALFWIFVALMGFAVWRHSARLVAGFLAVWMLGPMLAIFLVSWLIRPVEFPRYVLIAFIGMFAFAAFGAAAVRSTTLRLALAIVVVYLSAPQVHELRYYSGPDWQQAAALAARATASGDRIAVYTYQSLGVVRYYLPSDRRADAVAMNDECGGARLLIIRARGILSAQNVPAARTCYPNVFARAPGLEVRTR